MKKNYQTCLMGSKVILVPYRPEHVTNYHGWMQSPFLLEMTGSEPLTLEEEIEMQQTWKNDANKCTFIVLVKSACRCENIRLDVGENKVQLNSFDLDSFIVDTLEAMIGDVNLFLSEIEDDDEDDENSENEIKKHMKAQGIQAELDIMIAEENYRKMGMGQEATLLMMLYGAQNLEICRYIVKIKEDNVASLNMFEKMGFKKCNFAECFREYELQFSFSSCEEMIGAIENMYKHHMYVSFGSRLKSTILVHEILGD